MVSCAYCRPHANRRKQRLCHVGQKLFDAYREAGEKWAELSAMMDPPTYSLNEAKKRKDQARAEYRAHIEGDN